MLPRNHKVLGVGWHKTGTSTLGACLVQLGLTHAAFDSDGFALYRRGDVGRLLDFMEGVQSFQDWPWALLYREADRRFPDAKFVLTTRTSSEAWLGSLLRHAEHGPTEVRRALYGHAMPHGHEAEHVARYERHNAEVRAYFRDRPGKLLEVCWEDGDGWRELADFLGLPCPDAPFPHVNPSRPVRALREAPRTG
ncbi:MAG: sulfotransferase family protein [Planctomycetota bacterium]